MIFFYILITVIIITWGDTFFPHIFLCIILSTSFYINLEIPFDILHSLFWFVHIAQVDTKYLFHLSVQYVVFFNIFDRCFFLGKFVIQSLFEWNDLLWRILRIFVVKPPFVFKRFKVWFFPFDTFLITYLFFIPT